MSSLFFLINFLFFFFFLPPTVIGDGNAVLSGAVPNCLHNATDNNNSTTFQQNLRLALRDLTNLSSSGIRYNITSTGSGIDQAYAMFQCRGDLSSQDCFACVSNATISLPTLCPSFLGARIQLDGCYVRYDNQTFFTADFSYVIAYCYAPTTDSVGLQIISSLMLNVTTLAPKNGGYAAESAGGEYALAQCLGYLDESECSRCLTSVSWRVVCDSTLGEQYHTVSCYYRYEPYSFFSSTPPPPPSPFGAPPPTTPASPTPPPSTQKTDGSTTPPPTTQKTEGGTTPPPTTPALPTPPPTTQKTEGWKIAVISVGAVVGALFATVPLCLTLVRRHHAWKDLTQDDTSTQPVFQPTAEVYSLHELEVATGNFHPDNKLGEGGFGPVYKGILPNGQSVAVKKLSLRSKQGKREFMNEVNLITSVQHRNLIKLLGGCVEGPERILVYEYLPNKSVDALLFEDLMDVRTLDWPTRYGIVLGTARGLAYLHEDSQVRIIHRDIKPSNILLDDQLNPKISDFGLARLVSEDESHINTRVAGTLGYLAPEYAVLGELSEKVDVFSFGVVTLEVVSGRRNLSTGNEGLLEWTWRLYREHRQLELVDPKLGATFLAEQVVRVVHVALLCTQEIAALRPTMSTVTLFLSGRSEIMEIPTKPAYVGLSDTRAHVDSTDRFRRTPSLDSSSNPVIQISHNGESMSEVEPR